MFIAAFADPTNALQLTRTGAEQVVDHALRIGERS
jgi:hypothetical protein